VVCDNGDRWAEGCVTLETGGPMNELQLRWLGRGVCDNGDGWAEWCVTMEMGGPSGVPSGV